MADATIEVGQQGGGFVGDDGGLEVGAGEVADGIEGTPGGLDHDFDLAFDAPEGNGGSQVARDAAELGYNVYRKVIEIAGQLRLRGTCGPMTRDCSGQGCCRRSGFVVTDDDVPGADFPFFREAVDDVRILAGEGFDFASVVHVENEQG